MFGFRSTRQQVKGLCNRSGDPEHNDIESGGGVSGAEPESVDQDLEKADCAQPIVLCIGTSSLDLDCPYSLPEIVVPPVEVNYSKVETPCIARKEHNLERASWTVAPKVSTEVLATTPPRAASIPAPNLEASANHERIRKYAEMRTLKLPGRQLRPMKAPTQAELALRRINEELAVEACQRDEYCARELAGHGIFMHLPAAKAQSDAMISPRAARRIWRETSIGPLNPSWGARHAKGAPMIKVSRPEIVQTQKATVGAGPGSDHSFQTLAATPSERGGVRSNAVYVPSKAPAATRPAPERLSLSPREATAVSAPVHETPRAPARHRSKDRGSMSDWLTAISTGSNPLVADHVAVKARPFLRASLILSPPSTPPLSPTDSISSSDSSVPSTPIDELFLPSSLVEETQVVDASSERRRRVRCSYLGGGYDAVTVAPGIPEELLTDEIGVAC
ncbi:hypothetical protein RSAG8_08849, partial [Rhizoctonia solani AG-8 WAC10335]